MDKPLRLPAVAFLAAVFLMVGCVPGLRSAKSTAVEGQPGARGKAGESTVGGKPSDKRSLDRDNLLPTPPPPDQAASLSGERMPSVGPAVLANKDEINETALLLAENVPKTEGAKTCFSKSLGVWMLLLYVRVKLASLLASLYDSKVLGTDR